MPKIADILKARGLLQPKENKLHNKSMTVDGIAFASQREARRYLELKALQNAGKIKDLKLQVMYELIPAAYHWLPTGEVYQKGERKGRPKYKRVCVEKAVKYIADFEYEENGQTVVEDAKGFRKTDSAAYKVFVLKRKLMLWRYGIKVKEV